MITSKDEIGYLQSDKENIVLVCIMRLRGYVFKNNFIKLLKYRSE